MILIDKSLDDVDQCENKLLNLIHPKMTHMDFNISTALHLASKGEGYAYDQIIQNVNQLIAPSNFN